MVYKSTDWFENVECQHPFSEAYGFAYRNACEHTLQKMLTFAGVCVNERLLFEMVHTGNSYGQIAAYFSHRFRKKFTRSAIRWRWVKIQKKLAIFRYHNSTPQGEHTGEGGLSTRKTVPHAKK